MSALRSRMSVAEGAAKARERDVDRLSKQLEAIKSAEYAATAAKLSNEDAAK